MIFAASRSIESSIAGGAALPAAPVLWAAVLVLLSVGSFFIG